MKNRSRTVFSALATSALVAFAPTPSMAQDPSDSTAPQAAASPQQVGVGDIIVTARKRSESIRAVPVAITAMNKDLIQALRIDRPADLGAMVPGLNLTTSTGASGGQLYLRGVGSGDSSPFMEAAVSVNVDGLQVSDAHILATGLFDLQQIEVLRGPQALFFGKNSPGGVISVRSADPSARTELIASAGYEFVENLRQFRGIISSPITETLSARLAASFSQKDGRFHLISVDDPTLGAYPLDRDKAPRSRELFLRGTLLYEPNADFTARLKAAYTNSYSGNRYSLTERIYCPYGAPQAIIPIDDCRLNATTYQGQINPKTLGELTDGDPSRPDGFERLEQLLTSLELQYQIAAGLQLTSVTGYFDSSQFNQSEHSWQPTSLLSDTTRLTAHQFTQEFRLSSSWSGPFNFTTGAFFEDKAATNVIDNIFAPIVFGGPDPVRLAKQASHSGGKTYSVFGQADYDILPTFRISAGGRYTSERKDVSIRINDVAVNIPDDAHRWQNFSPEISLRYRPSETTMFYLSYKRGFKSGGFDAGYNPGLQGAGPFNVRFDPEKVKGFEGGAKLSLLDRTLSINLAAFSYKYSGLQVTIFDPVTIGARILNAAQASVKGIELDWTWSTPLDGFSLNGAANYLDSEYDEYLADCYTGQTVAGGCQTSGGRSFQDMAGKSLPFASRWSGNLGFSYKHAMASDWSLRLDGSAVYTGKYHAMVTDAPGSTQSRFVTLNASATLATPDDQWQLSLRGVDLTNQLHLGQVFEVPLTGGGTVRPDLGSVAAGGRTVMLELRYALR